MRTEAKNPPPEPATRNIILAGFMGTGKSSIGRHLAEALSWTMIDTDELIEQRTGKTISRIFAEDGELAFRAIEAEVACQMAGLERHVIATGGGMVLAPANLQALEAAGAVILLEASPETIYRRIAHHTNRPLMAKPDPRGEIEALLASRREAYQRVGFRVATDGKTQGEIAREILDRLRPTAQATASVRVELGDRSYPIRIGQGWATGGLGEALQSVFSPRPCVLVSNPRIRELWGAPVLASLERAGYQVSCCEIPEGEEHKHLATVEKIYDHYLDARLTRQGGLIALGGGVVGDITGFAAATLLRGIAFVQIPTTLLAMVDSSVGGKTGVNHRVGKNLIGAFWQPTFVGIELEFLSTLSDTELRSGLAEVIKYGVIADAELFDYLERNIERALERDPEVLTHLITRSCQIKADVVGRDERESGLREILNYGHTFGHAAEALTHYQSIRHGEGVAMGMVAAARLACNRGMIDEADVSRLEDLLRRAGLPARMLPFPAAQYWTAMGSDKKVRDGKIGFVLPERLGQVATFRDISRLEVERCLAALTDPAALPAGR